MLLMLSFIFAICIVITYLLYIYFCTKFRYLMNQLEICFPPHDYLLGSRKYFTQFWVLLHAFDRHPKYLQKIKLSNSKMLNVNCFKIDCKRLREACKTYENKFCFQLSHLGNATDYSAEEIIISVLFHTYSLLLSPWECLDEHILPV